MLENPTESQLHCEVAGDTCHTVTTMKMFITCDNGLTAGNIYIYTFWGIIPNTKKWNNRIHSPNKFICITLHVQIYSERQQQVYQTKRTEKISPTWSWGRQFWLTMIHYILPSTTPHRSTQCLPSPNSDFHIIHTRNYRNDLQFQLSFKKSLLSLHILYHSDIFVRIFPCQRTSSWRCTEVTGGTHQPTWTSTTGAST